MSDPDIDSFSKNDLTGADILKHIISNAKIWETKPKQALFNEYVPIESRRRQLQQQRTEIYRHQTSRRSRIEDLVQYKKVLTNKADPFEVNDFICTKELLKKARFGVNNKPKTKHTYSNELNLDANREKVFGLSNVRQKALQTELIEGVEVDGQKPIEHKAYWSKKNIKSFMTYKKDYNHISKQNDNSYVGPENRISSKNKLSLSFDFQAKTQTQQLSNKLINTRNIPRLNADSQMQPQSHKGFFFKKDMNQSFDQSKVKPLNLSRQNQNLKVNASVIEARNDQLINPNEESSLMSQNDHCKISDKSNIKNLLNLLSNIEPENNRAHNLRYKTDSNFEKDFSQAYQNGSYNTNLKESGEKPNSALSSAQKFKSSRTIKGQAGIQREHNRCVTEQDTIQTRRCEEYTLTNNEIKDTNRSISSSLSPERQRCQDIMSKSFEMKKDLRKSSETLKRMTRNYNNRNRKIESTFTNLQKVSDLSPDMLQVIYYYNKEIIQNDKMERNLVLKDYCERKEGSSILSDEAELKLTRTRMKKLMTQRRAVKCLV